MAAPAVNPALTVRLVYQSGTDQATVARFKNFASSIIDSTRSPTSLSRVDLIDEVAVKAELGTASKAPILLLDTFNSASEVKKLDYLAGLASAIAVVHFMKPATSSSDPEEVKAARQAEVNEVYPKWNSMRGPSNDRRDFTILFVPSNNIVTNLQLGRLVEIFKAIAFKFDAAAATATLEENRKRTSSTYASPAPTATASPDPTSAIPKTVALASDEGQRTEIKSTVAEGINTALEEQLNSSTLGIKERILKAAAQIPPSSVAPVLSEAASAAVPQPAPGPVATLAVVAAPAPTTALPASPAAAKKNERMVTFKTPAREASSASEAIVVPPILAKSMRPVESKISADGSGGKPPSKWSWWHPATLFALTILVRFAVQAYFRKPLSLV